MSGQSLGEFRSRQGTFFTQGRFDHGDSTLCFLLGDALLPQPSTIGCRASRRSQGQEPWVIVPVNKVECPPNEPCNDERAINGKGAVHIPCRDARAPCAERQSRRGEVLSLHCE